MKIGVLLRYSLYLLIMILITFMILTLYIYFFSNTSTVEIAYSFVAPLCIFIVSLLYSRSIHERGLLRGIEIWIIYFVVALLLKLITVPAAELSIVQHLINLPVSVLGGVIGVNLKK